MIGIDLGSNTLRACKMDKNGEILWDFERIVGSARNLSSQGLADDAKERIFSALKELRNKLNKNEKYFAGATAAFRKAQNAKDFLNKVKQELGIEFSVISGEDEAKFTQLGIISRLKKLGIYDENALFIDLGGASTEISFKNIVKSFDFGIVSFCNLRFDISKICAPALEFMANFTPKIIVLNSGVPTSIAALKIGLNYENYNAKFINGIILKKSDFDFAKNLLQTSKNTEILVGKNRSDLMLAGIEILSYILKEQSASFVVIDDGLREGLCMAVFNGLLKAKKF